MSDQAIVEKLKGKFSSTVLDVVEHRGETTVTVEKEKIVEVCTFMRDECGYNFLADLCGVDYLGQEPRFMGCENTYPSPYSYRSDFIGFAPDALRVLGMTVRNATAAVIIAE